jgi:quercetin dioxygenase-like cupin family protein
MEGITVKKIKPVHTDERGSISDILNAKINHIGIITTEKGAIRANHYHKNSIQYCYVLSGKFEVLVAKPDKKADVERIVLGPGELIKISPGIIHRFRAIEKSDIIEITSESREGARYEDDVIRIPIVGPED